MNYIIETVLRSSNFSLRRLRNFYSLWKFSYANNMGLYKLEESFEQNYKNINELHHWNCLTIKQFQFTKTQEFYSLWKFCYKENMGFYTLAEWFEQNIKNMNELHHWNCCTVKQFQFTETYRNSIRCENFVTKRMQSGMMQVFPILNKQTRAFQFSQVYTWSTAALMTVVY